MAVSGFEGFEKRLELHFFGDDPKNVGLGLRTAGLRVVWMKTSFKPSRGTLSSPAHSLFRTTPSKTRSFTWKTLSPTASATAKPPSCPPRSPSHSWHVFSASTEATVVSLQRFECVGSVVRPDCDDVRSGAEEGVQGVFRPADHVRIDHVRQPRGVDAGSPELWSRWDEVRSCALDEFPAAGNVAYQTFTARRK
ncbi:hypothetical protein M0R45_001253 [Rubus argutus]|uniref:Uncharacterized protein n=1 Tax=Rubus argutus TaxID=59490 RepID=A0AAW1VIG8_RUBAR